MSSKPFIFLCLLFAIVVLFPYAKSKEATMETVGVDDVKRGGGGLRGGSIRFRGGGSHHSHDHCHHGCCHHHHGVCSSCCSFAKVTVDAEPQAKPNN